MIENIFGTKYQESDDVETILNELDLTRKYREWVGKLPGRFMKWLEAGSLIPLLILVSIYNIAIVLTRHYPVVIAAAVAVLIDIAIYQNIMAIRKRTGRLFYDLLTWIVFFLSLAYSLYFHLQFYYPVRIFSTLLNAIVYSSLIPFSIFGIAWRLYVQHSAEGCEKAGERSGENGAGEREKNSGETTAKNTKKSGVESTVESGEKSREESAVESRTDTGDQNANEIAKKSGEKARVKPPKKQKKKRGKKREKIIKTKGGKCLICGKEKKYFSLQKWAAHFNQKSHRDWTPKKEVKNDGKLRNNTVITS